MEISAIIFALEVDNHMVWVIVMRRRNESNGATQKQKLKMNTYYSIVTFGSPSKKLPKYTTDKAKAVKLAGEEKGSGRCTHVRVYACKTVALATSADISEIRKGEAIVHHA